MAYSNYVALIHFLITIASLIYAFYASLFLILKKPHTTHQVIRTPVVSLYFYFTASSSFLLLIYSGYALFWWRADENVYNPNVLYFIAGLPTIYVNLVPVADFYLCVDRLFAFAFPILYQDNLKNTLAASFLMTDSFILFAYFYVTKYFTFFTPETTTTCVYYICLIWRLNYPLIMTYTKYVFCGLNFIVSVILLALIFFRKSAQLSNKLNKPVIYVSMINIFFAFAPALILELLLKIMGTGKSFTEYVGDINLTCISISIALSVHLYYRVFKKHFLKPAVTVVKIASAKPHTRTAVTRTTPL